MEWKPGRGARSDSGRSDRPVLDHARLRTARRAMKRPKPEAPPGAPAPKGEGTGHGGGDGRRPGPRAGAASRAEDLLADANACSAKPGGVRPKPCRIVCAGALSRTGAANAGVPTVGASARGRDPVSKDPATTTAASGAATPEAEGKTLLASVAA